ncbi:hypothetical protein DFH27DRAFT_547622 [Peziza echinospora]|nr:hypothetical protein DFH27DRAFT_547622 [Peziza echinospora]
MAEPERKKTSSLDSTFPVLVPQNPALFYQDDKFAEYALSELREAQAQDEANFAVSELARARGDAIRAWQSGRSNQAESDEVQSTTGDSVMTGTDTTAAAAPQATDPKLASPFVSALIGAVKPGMDPADTTCWGPAPGNMQRTTNNMPSLSSTLTPTLDLFNDLQGDVKNASLKGLLERAWAQDPLETLKVIFHARSIHLGKGEKDNFYKCLGWLSRFAGVRGKATVLANLEWVAKRTIIKPKKEEKKEDAEKKEGKAEVPKEKKGGEEEEEEEEDPNDPVFSHGYWKDLANILVLDARGALDVTKHIHEMLNTPEKGRGKVADVDSLNSDDEEGEEATDEAKKAKAILNHNKKKALAKIKRHQKEKSYHEYFISHFNSSPFYRLLHLTTARAFGVQLKQDLDALKSGDKKRIKKITFAAKWAPSLENFHDRYSLLATSIAEYLFPPEHPLVADHAGDRVTYLKYAREHYRRLYLSPLRKALAVVEVNISANKFADIDYRRVPSLAMNRYKKLFRKKDSSRFLTFLRQVAAGTATIAGAVLTPASLVYRAQSLNPFGVHKSEFESEKTILNAQWESLVRSVQENGTMENSLAVVDVSGSMTYPVNPDGTTPLHAAIGLGLLLSEVSAEPFKDLMITFSASPKLVRTDGKKVGDTSEKPDLKFYDKVKIVNSFPWGMNTNFLAVFESLLLPLAVKHQLKQEDMVKKIFVFTDMGFDEAEVTKGELDGDGRLAVLFNEAVHESVWETGHERLERLYKEAGYELPQMVYWNLAAGGGVSGKQVTGEKEGCVMLSGSGAGTLKAFVERGLGADEEEEEEEVVVEEEVVSEDEDMVLVEKEDAMDEEAEDGKRKIEEVEGEVAEMDLDGGEKKKKTVAKKRKIDPLTAMRKLFENPAYEGLKIVG